MPYDIFIISSIADSESLAFLVKNVKFQIFAIGIVYSISLPAVYHFFVSGRDITSRPITVINNV